MILKETLKQIAESQREVLTGIKDSILREKLAEIDLNTNHAIIISGIRRSGKSTLLKQLIDKTKRFYYFNFEDSRASNFELNDFEKLDEIFNEQDKKNINYFFDEIQNVPRWEIFVRTLLDKKKKVFITGSNASLLSRELGTRLTGRHIRYELYPFSYPEFLKIINKKPSIRSFEEYFKKGGFPEYIEEKNIRLLQELFNDIITRDIIVRHNIRNYKLVKDIALYLLSNAGKEFTYQSLKKIFNPGSVNTVISILAYYEESYLLFSIPKFEFSLKKQIRNARKIYAVDTGLIDANSTSFSSDHGRILENIVFLELKRKGNIIYYYRRKNECDFVVKLKDNSYKAYQICYKLTEDNKDREINGLTEAMEELNLKTGYILTHEQEDGFKIKNKKIVVMPVWKWIIMDN